MLVQKVAFEKEIPMFLGDVQKCVKPARVFINRILAVFRKNTQIKNIRLSEEFHSDIQWLMTFLPSYNGISYIKKHQVDQKQSLYLDAS